MNDRINDLAMQLAEELEKYEKKHGAPQAPNFQNTSVPEVEAKKPDHAEAVAVIADIKIRLRIVEMVLTSELEIEDTDTLREVMETIYDFVAAYEVE